MKPKIVVFSGSTRPGSFNEKLAVLGAAHLAVLGAEVTHISLKDYPLSFVDASGFGNHPKEALALRNLFDSHHGMFIACPEYNAGYPALLKNALDWASVAIPGAPASTLAGKVVALGSASPGPMGGYRALTQLRSTLELGYGATLVPSMVAVGNYGTAFKDDGSLSDERTAGFLSETLATLVSMTKKLNA